MQYHEDCPHCGKRITAYTLPLNEGLVRGFLKFVDARIRLGAPVRKGALGLTNSEYGNFQNLRHFHLVAQIEKGAAWEVTDVGWAFLRGELKVLTPAGHFGGATMDSNHPGWRTHHHPRKAVSVRDVLPDEWKSRPMFQAEKVGA